MTDFLFHNRRAWDDRVRRGQAHTRPARDGALAQAAETASVHDWVDTSLAGQRVLCLAAGGGKHGPVYAAAGAQVTVVDLSPRMLERDRHIAASRSLSIHTLETSMDDLSALESAQFDLVVQPVSTCYVPDIRKVYAEVARVLRAGGLYISQHKQPACLQAETPSRDGGYRIREPYYRSGPLPESTMDTGHREAGCMEFLHRWEQLIGGLCRSGFVIEDLREPRSNDASAAPGTLAHRSHYLPPFVAMKARRVGSKGTPSESIETTSALWVPGS